MNKGWMLLGTVGLLVAGLATGNARAAEKAKKGEEQEVKVTLDQVPAAVKATLVKEARGAAIKSVDKEGEGAKTVYEADVVINGQNWEIKVGPDGKLLGKKLDPEEKEKPFASPKPEKSKRK
jgi:hypothetical protein